MNKFKKNDIVKILTGKDKGKSGKVLKVLTKTNQLIIEDLNKRFKHVKDTQEKKGGILEINYPIHNSNIMHFNEKDNIVSKISYEIKKDKKTRILKKSKLELK